MFFICGSASPVEMSRLWNCQSAEISHLWQPPTHTSGLPVEVSCFWGSASPAQVSQLRSSLPVEVPHLHNCLTCAAPSTAQLSPVEVPHLHNCLTCGRPSPAQLSHLWKFLTCTTASPVEVPHLHNCLTCGSSSSAQLPHLWKFLTGTTVSPGRVSPVKVPHFCGSASPAHDLAVEVPHLWQCPIVPDVAMVGEDVFDIAKLALLHILLDRVHLLLLADLVTKQNFICVCVLTCINTVTPPPQHTYPQAAIDPRGKTAVHPPNVTTKGVISPGNVAHYHRKVAPWRLCKHV